MRSYDKPTQRIDLAKTARDVFGLRLPFSAEQLTKAYRNVAKAVHPDAAEGSHEAFIVLVEQYESLQAICENVPQRTVDGTSLSELGRGLGPRKKGINCSVCNASGYTTKYEDGGLQRIVGKERQPVWHKCSNCNGTGEVEIKLVIKGAW